MAQFRAATLILDNQTYDLVAGKINSFDTFYVDFQYTVNGPDALHCLLFLHPKQDILVEQVTLSLHFPRGSFQQVTTFGLNSAQGSATFSLAHNNVQQMGLYEGDPFAQPIPVGKGLLHSWSYLQFSGPKQSLWCTSGNESAGFTSVLYDMAQEVLTFRKDLGKGMRVTHSFPALDVRVGAQVPVPETALPPAKGIIAVSEGASGIPNALSDLQLTGLPFTHCLISQGWAAHTGDWLSGGQQVQALVRDITGQGLVPVLAMSPFAVSPQSDLARRNPDWLQQYQGKPATFTTSNGQTAYALDVFHGGVREFLSGVFHLYADRMGIRCFQLEDLYAACLVPKTEKTRGQMMHEALTLLRQLAGDALLIGAQVPLGAAAGHLNAVQMGELAIQQKNNQWAWKYRDCLRPVQSLVAAQALRGQLWAVAGQRTAAWATKTTHVAAAQYSYLVANALLSDWLYLPCPGAGTAPEIICELEAACQLHRASDVRVSQVTEQVLRVDYRLDGAKAYNLLNMSPKPEQVEALRLEGHECW